MVFACFWSMRRDSLQFVLLDARCRKKTRPLRFACGGSEIDSASNLNWFEICPEGQRSLASLARLDLSVRDLTGYDLDGADLREYKFVSSTLDKANS
jgi:hypothetical protein